MADESSKNAAAFLQPHRTLEAYIQRNIRGTRSPFGSSARSLLLSCEQAASWTLAGEQGDPEGKGHLVLGSVAHLLHGAVLQYSAEAEQVLEAFGAPAASEGFDHTSRRLAAGKLRWVSDRFVTEVLRRRKGFCQAEIPVVRWMEDGDYCEAPSDGQRRLRLVFSGLEGWVELAQLGPPFMETTMLDLVEDRGASGVMVYELKALSRWPDWDLYLRSGQILSTYLHSSHVLGSRFAGVVLRVLNVGTGEVVDRPVLSPPRGSLSRVYRGLERFYEVLAQVDPARPRFALSAYEPCNSCAYRLHCMN